MKRLALYEMVWTKPMSRLASELGISDVGLAKACRRNGIPLPQRGYWAKRQVGKAPERPPLPSPELDVEVSFTTMSQEKRSAAAAHRRRETEAVAEKVDEVRKATVSASPRPPRRHPLIKATADYCARIPTLMRRKARISPMDWRHDQGDQPPRVDNGRWLLDVPNGLEIVVSEAALPWALDYLDDAFRMLQLAGATVARAPMKDKERATNVCSLAGEKVALSFREGYRRQELSKEELARAKAENRWAREWQYVASGAFTLTLAGTEREATKQWIKSREGIENKKEEVVATCLRFLEQQPDLRRARLAEEDAQRKRAQEEERLRRIHDARRQQLEQAYKASEAYERMLTLERFLDVVEGECNTYNDPHKERAKVWVGVVRQQLKSTNQYQQILGECLATPSWKPWPPEWWPNENESRT